MAESLRPQRCRAAVLPVVVVVVNHQAEGLAAVAARRIGFVNGKLRAVQHAIAARLVGMVVDWTEKADANFAEVLEIGIGDVASRAVVFDQIGVVLIVRSGKL